MASLAVLQFKQGSGKVQSSDFSHFLYVALNGSLSLEKPNDDTDSKCNPVSGLGGERAGGRTAPPPFFFLHALFCGPIGLDTSSCPELQACTHSTSRSLIQTSNAPEPRCSLRLLLLCLVLS